MKITLVGAGALGSHALLFMRNLDAELRVIDFDRVEQRNVASQFHAKASVGKLKVQGLQQSMKFLFAKRVEVVPHKLTSDNVEQLLGNAELVIDCVDNGAARRLIQSFVRAHNIACVHGALAADGSFGRVVWDEHFHIDDEPSEGAATCEDGEQLSFIAMVSAYLAHAVRLFVAEQDKVGYQVHPSGADAT